MHFQADLERHTDCAILRGIHIAGKTQLGGVHLHA